MPIKNITVIDLALIELARGESDAPADVLEKLQAKGHISIIAGKPILTPKGKRRAEGLKDAEHDMRLMFQARTSGHAIQTVGGCSING